ncbi:universal stress protein [Metabacillus idriensis]|uniref:universal stress protein n=1 Tax=Metabacillus idriensis TaxID=324768 RepID=UPI002040E862|nr:universal stress protein [Metabacillus idriensis]MCM3594189.1 universal stress protein [Metabacillus idriensis]
MFKHILLASDGSEHAIRAAEKAAYLAGLSDGEVTILYVVDGSTSKSDVLSEGSSILREEKRKQRMDTTESIFRNKEIQYRSEILKGDPGPTVVDFANKNNYDLVVIGSRGLNGLQEMVLGSVSHKVAKRSNCTVMIVK